MPSPSGGWGVKRGGATRAAKVFDTKRQAESDPHDFRRALSDLSGIDILSHSNEPSRVVQAVRNWLCNVAGASDEMGPIGIWYRFNDFTSDLYDARKAQGFSDDDLDMMPVPEYVKSIDQWLAQQRSAGTTKTNPIGS